MDKDKLGLADIMPRYTPTEEIDVFATGGSVGDQYLEMMQGTATAPATMQDYQAEAIDCLFFCHRRESLAFMIWRLIYRKVWHSKQQAVSQLLWGMD